MFLVLSVFKRSHGHCEVPACGAPRNLQRWLHRQRLLACAGDLPVARRRRLEELGVVLEMALSDDERWTMRLLALRKFKKQFGHFNVPHAKGGPYRTLSVWLGNQRVVFKTGRLSEERCERLCKLGVALDPVAENWDRMFAGLIKFRKRHGHLEVPRHCHQPRGLGGWVNAQRMLFRKNRLEAERIERLNGTGFHWNPLDPRWDKYFRRLKEFETRHGHCNVPYEENGLLWQWLHKQRKDYQQGKLTRQRIERLDAIGFNWVRTWHGSKRVEGAWRRRIRELTAFKKKHGHCRVPQQSGNRRGLGVWVTNVRKDYHHGKLWPERVRELEALGFCWKFHDGFWEERFAELVAYKQQHGHCNVSQDDPNRRLSFFVQIARRKKKERTLSVERRERLESLGFVWNVTEMRGDRRLAELRAFRREHGHCNVPQTHANHALAAFVCGMRLKKRKNALSPARVAVLEELGFEWEPHATKWERFFARLAQFRQGHGHCRVPSSGPDNALVAWVQRQRCRRDLLEPDRRQRLEALGFEWRTRTLDVLRAA